MSMASPWHRCRTIVSASPGLANALSAAFPGMAYMVVENIVMVYVVVANIVMAYVVVAYMVMAHKVVASWLALCVMTLVRRIVLRGVCFK